MSRNRYIKDYRLVEAVSEKGRIHTDYEYIGPVYWFQGDGAFVRRTLRKALGLILVGWVLFVAAMIPVSQAMRTFYVSFPFFFAAVPLTALTGMVAGVLAAGEKLEHRHADKMENRYPPNALFLFLLPAVSLIGEGILAAAGGKMEAGDAVFTAAAAIMCCCGFWLFRLRKILRCTKQEP